MENKKATDQFVRDEARALKNKETGKSYTVSDFTFRFKTSPKYRNDFKELVATFLYKNKEINYYCFVNAKLNRKEAIEAAKIQIRHLIGDGGITLYAKKYYQKFYNN